MPPTDPPAADGALPATLHASSGAASLPLRFTGSGSEYFRIWIVNLLLTLLTLTLYWPFARARRIAYFQSNTLVGADPLGFHADPWKMFRGYGVVLVLGLVYWVVTRFLPAFGWMALLAVALLWPPLWRASLQFRLRNTSWRGVRMDFAGSTAGAYGVLLPFFLPALLLVWLVPDGTGDTVRAGGAPAAAGLVTLAFAVATPWLMLRVKRYQHGAYAFTQERTALQVGAGAFYGLHARAAAVAVAAVLLVLAVLAALAFLVLGMGQRETLASLTRPGAAATGVVLVLAGGFALLYLLIPLVVLPYYAARLQNLLWGGTRSRHIVLHSRLRFRDLLRVNAVNWLLIALTLGLFWPFAKVRAARVRLQAMSVVLEGPVEEWLSEGLTAGRGVLGDAAGDFLGIDMGL